MTDRALDAVAELEDRFENKIMDLEKRVDELEDELEDERRRRRRAERALAERDRESEKTRNDFHLYRKSANKQRESIKDRLFDIERGEVDPGEVVAEQTSIDASELLPLHQKYTAARNLEPESNGLTNNQEIAARCFPYLAEKSFDDGHGTLVLPSTKLREIIEDEVYSPELAKRLDVKNPNPNTVRRVIGFVEDFAGEVVKEIDRDSSPTRIKLDREAWVSYTKRVQQQTDAASASGGEDYAVVMSD